MHGSAFAIVACALTNLIHLNSDLLPTHQPPSNMFLLHISFNANGLDFRCLKRSCLQIDQRLKSVDTELLLPLSAFPPGTFHIARYPVQYQRF